ncbi:plexin-A4-like [Mya arenaria]|uniref:plexin-A4-like n=1 Tax=Mya arenaria TaxID=6604 RepID=UPI0022E1FE8F|nr:plexin-A4-like [Mya arenaria]
MALSRLIIFWLWLLATGNIVFSQDNFLKKQKQPLIAISNVEFFNNTIYVGAMDKLLKFDLDLQITKKVDTCTGSCDSNYNKVLVISEKTQRVLHCGTGYGGMCEMRNLTDLSQSLLNTSQSTGIIAVKVSTDRKRPASAIFTSEMFYLAKSFGDNVQFNENENEKYCGILARDQIFDYQTVNPPCIYIELRQKTKLEDYVIYYKDTFIYGDNVYFLTNQKKYVGANDYVSKVVRLCMKDTSYQSHIDMELTCENDGMVYNLIQDSVILNVSGNSVLVAVFANGSDPENISGTGIICTLDMKTINKELQESLRGFETNCSYNNSNQYLNLVGNCLLTNQSSLNNFTCKANDIPIRYFAIGSGKVELHWNDSSFAHEGYFTSLHSSQYNQNDVVFAGTSNGFVVKYVMTKSGLHRYEQLLADEGNEVKDMIILNDDHFFVISESNVLKYQSTDCTEYKTCKDLMENKNPLCGWCVYENKSSRNDQSCKYSGHENHWIPSQGECVSIDADPKAYPSGVGLLRVTLTAKHLPERLSMDSYKCKIDGKHYIASINDTQLTCNINNINGMYANVYDYSTNEV